MQAKGGISDLLLQTVRPTTIIESAGLSKVAGVRVTIASETFQWTGSFKFRAAFNVAISRQETSFITASSGNFGQALAHAAKIVGKHCTVVMPETSARVKIEATESAGARLELVDVSKVSRAQRVSELSALSPDSYVASAYDDPLVIAGNSTLGMELAALQKDIDCIIAPVGGGGLISGIRAGLNAGGKQFLPVVGAEPLLGNDAAQSLRQGKIISNQCEPQTIADGARTVSLGKHNWEIIKSGIAGMVEVPEDKIEEAVRLLFTHANLKVEPTGALALAAILTKPGDFSGKHCLVIASGGNVDPAVFCRIINT